MQCNLQYRHTRTIPVVFHNLTHYDSHFIIKEIAAAFPGDIDIIPTTDQIYISFTASMKGVSKVGRTFEERIRNTIKFKFIDSFKFMASSLDKLASYLPSHKKTILRHELKHSSELKIRMLERKGVFPYDFVDSWAKLDYSQLPEKESFYSRLNDTHVSDDDYSFAKSVWIEFNIKNLGEYADLYLMTDIFLLADVFENFRQQCLAIYDLDPAHYFTVPGYSWDCMLKYTKVEIELLTDIEMYLYVERGIKGGIAQCSKRYAKANNKYVGYDPADPTSYIIYLDVNNLYGFSMMGSLPLSGFSWIENMDLNGIFEMVKDPEIGCLVEADIHYPESLHEGTSDYPFCAEHSCPPGSRHKKLLLTLTDKKRYVIHHRMLQFVVQEGMIVEKIYRVLKFTQKPFLNNFITLNTNHRMKSEDEFNKNLFKLMR